MDRAVLSEGAGWLGGEPMRCAACDRAALAPPEWAGRACPACARGALEPAPALDPGAEPELTIPFVERDLAEPLLAFVRENPYPPADLTAKNLVARLTPIWLPGWLVDARVVGHWSARAGFEEDARSTREVLRDGRWITVHEQARQLRWSPRAGRIQRRYDNAPAAAMAADLESLMGGWERAAARPTQPEDLTGRAVWLPDLRPDAARPDAEAALTRAAAGDVRRAADADALDDFTLTADFRDLHWTWILRPAWSTWYRDDDDVAWRLLVHGQRHTVVGPRRASPAVGRAVARKWAIGAGITGLIAVVTTLGSLLMPMFFFGATLAGFVSIVAALGALAAWTGPDRWNRREDARRGQGAG